MSSGNGTLRHDRPSTWRTKRRYNAGTERRSKKGRGGRRGLLLIWSLITEGPRAPGPWDRYSQKTRVALSLFLVPSSFSSRLLRVSLQRAPNYLRLHIYLLSPSRSSPPACLSRRSLFGMHYASEDRVINVDYAVAPGLSFRERNRELGSPQTVTLGQTKRRRGFTQKNHETDAIATSEDRLCIRTLLSSVLRNQRYLGANFLQQKTFADEIDQSITR